MWGQQGEGFNLNSMVRVDATEETLERRPERGEGMSPVLISRTTGGNSSTKTLRQ